MLDRQVRANQPVEEDGIRRLDIAGITPWLVEALSRYRGQPVERIVPVGHGAGVVALKEGGLAGECAFPPLDYEQPIPADIMAAYHAERDGFAITGSPALPDGLNIGRQLYWLDRLHPEVMRTATLVPWAQYWAWFLSGAAVSEVTSLGCHSDLWDPAAGRFAPMAERMGWAARFAPVARAGDVVGTLRPALVEQTGLPVTTQVLAGLHDSNAALLAARGFPEIAGQEATILSTGTWFIAMRLKGAEDRGRLKGAEGEARLAGDESSIPILSEARDCLINVDAYGRPVPSARFMGGREIETVIELDTRRVDITPDQPALLAAVPALVESGAMLLPTLAPGCGPFPAGPGTWIGRPDDWYARRAAACLYAALVAATSLDLIGSHGRLLVEGRFAEADVFVRALASLRPDMEVYTANAHNDVSFGALRLSDPDLRPEGQLVRAAPLPVSLDAYRARWLANMGLAELGVTA